MICFLFDVTQSSVFIFWFFFVFCLFSSGIRHNAFVTTYAQQTVGLCLGTNWLSVIFTRLDVV